MSRMFFIHTNTLLTCVAAASLLITVNLRVVFKECTVNKPKLHERCSEEHAVRKQRAFISWDPL